MSLTSSFSCAQMFDDYSIAHAPSQFTVGEGKQTYTITKPGIPMATMGQEIHPLNIFEAKTSTGVINKFYYVEDKQQFVMIPNENTDSKASSSSSSTDGKSALPSKTICAKPWIRGDLGVPLTNPYNSFSQQMITLCHIRAQIIAGNDKSIHDFGKPLLSLSKNPIQMRNKLSPDYLKGVLDTIWLLLNDSQRKTLFDTQLMPEVANDDAIRLYNHIFNSRTAAS